jgi:hypothetical protein
MKESKAQNAQALQSLPTPPDRSIPPIVEQQHTEGYMDVNQKQGRDQQQSKRNDSHQSSQCLRSSDVSILQIVEQRIQGYHSTSSADMNQKVKTTQTGFAAAPRPYNDDDDQEEDPSEKEGSMDSFTLEKLIQARLAGTTDTTAANITSKHAKTAPGTEGTVWNTCLTEEQRLAKSPAAASVVHGTAPSGNDAEYSPLTKKAVATFATTNLTRQERNSNHAVYQQPGAYQGALGIEPVRTAKPRFSLLGRELDPESTSFEREDWMAADKSTKELDMLMPQRSSQTTTSTSAALSVATPIDSSGMFNLPIAEEQGEWREGSKKHSTESTPAAKERRKLFIAMSIILAIAGVTLLIVFLVVNDDSQDEADTTAPPTMAPSTVAPTLSLRDRVMQLLPNSTVRQIELFADTAPQAKALQWILDERQTLLDTYSPERIQQRFALATLYYATNGDNWSNNSGWLDYDSHECSWFSRHWFEDVEMYMGSAGANTFTLMYDSRTYPCSENTTGGDYEHLWLYRNQLEGTLPFVELALLTSLKSLSLFTNNELSITLSSELGHLPKLEGIEISGLEIDGSIPTEIGLLTNLKAILASNNRITGTIPTEYGLLTSLIYSMLSENQISGTLPSELGGMSALEWFYLYGNQASGNIPTEFLVGRSTTMKLFNMFTNRLTGILPTEIGLLTNLELMSLADNELTGFLPSELGQLSVIAQGLALDRNKFRGTIPSDLGNLRTITGIITGSGTYGLGLSGNQFTGHVPSELGMLTLLERISLQDNFLTGTLPSELAGMVTLETFGGQNNNFTGLSVPDWMMVLQANRNESLLVEWDVTGNPFLSGVVPSPLCGVWKFDCSSLLCGCNCPCPAS